MRTQVCVFLEKDTIEHILWVRKQLAEQRKATVSMSEAIEWLAKNHWKKVMKSQAVAGRLVQ
mgnify:CR=1 FL=1